MAKKQQTIVFIHGLWLHAGSWTAWEEFFQKAGYKTMAPFWPGDSETVKQCRQHPEKIADRGISEVADHFKKIIKKLDSKPILIGHSFGGLLVQILLGDNVAAAGVAIDPAQMRGVLPLPFSQLKSGFPVLGNPLNYHKAISLTKEQFRYGFGNAISQKESDALYEKWTIPAPAKPLFQAAFANLNPGTEAKVNTANGRRGPLLLIAGGKDHTVPAVVTKATFNLYKNSPAVTELKQFPTRGHSLTIDKGWKELASYSLTWLKEKNL